MSDLIKRIDGALVSRHKDEAVHNLHIHSILTDCKAEIQRLSAVGEPVGKEFYLLDLYKNGDGSYMENGLQVTFKGGRLVAVSDLSKPSVDALIAEIDEVLIGAPDRGVAFSLRRLADKYRSAK